MLSQRSDLNKNTVTKPFKLLLSIITFLMLSLSLMWLSSKVNWSEISLIPVTNLKTTTQSIGRSLLTEYLLPFEIIAVTLLITLVGAAYVGSKVLKNK